MFTLDDDPREIALKKLGNRAFGLDLEVLSLQLQAEELYQSGDINSAESVYASTLNLRYEAADLVSQRKQIRRGSVTERRWLGLDQFEEMQIGGPSRKDQVKERVSGLLSRITS